MQLHHAERVYVCHLFVSEQYTLCSFVYCSMSRFPAVRTNNLFACRRPVSFNPAFGGGGGLPRTPFTATNCRSISAEWQNDREMAYTRFYIEIINKHSRRSLCAPVNRPAGIQERPVALSLQVFNRAAQ